MPAPSQRREGQDFFGNRITWITLGERHDNLTVKMSARVAVDEIAAPEALATPAFEAVREEVFATAEIGKMSPAHFVFPSRMVSLDPEIREYARASFLPGRPMLAGALDLMYRIKADMVYDTGATTVTTTPPMSFALRRGVCLTSRTS